MARWLQKFEGLMNLARDPGATRHERRTARRKAAKIKREHLQARDPLMGRVTGGNTWMGKGNRRRRR